MFAKLLLYVCLLMAPKENMPDPTKFDSGTPHVVLPIANATTGTVDRVAIPPDTDLQTLHESLVDGGYHFDSPTPSASGTIENSPAFRKSAADAWNAVQKGVNPWAESGFSVGKDGTPSAIRTEVTPDVPGMPHLPKDKITFHDSDKYIIHTHPNTSSIAGPSQNDIAAAAKIGKPIYTVSRGGLFMIDPQNKNKVTQVFKSATWMTDKDPK